MQGLIFLNKTFKEERLIYMQKYNLAAIKNSIVIYPEYFGRFLDKSTLQAFLYLKTKIIYLCTI